MRLETPYASAFFVNVTDTARPHNGTDACFLWDTFAAATGQRCELKSGDWLLDDRAELSEEFVTGTWSLLADYPGVRDFLRIEASDGVIRLYGSATPAAHHALGKLWEVLQQHGWQRYDSYSEALRDRDRHRSRTGRRRRARGGRHVTTDTRAEQLRRFESLGTASREGFGLFRNLMAVGFATSVFVGTEVLQPAVVVSVISALSTTVIVFTVEQQSARRRALTTS